jgi:hypothetical protein
MNFRQLERTVWKQYLEGLSDLMRGNQVELESIGLDIGDQIEEPFAPMDGVFYDPEFDTVFVHTRPNGHAIREPEQIVVEELGLTVRSVSVRDSRGRLRIITFRQPVLLPGPH